MDLITNATELIGYFREIDRSDVDVHGVSFPLAVPDVVTWNAGTRAYLLFRDAAGTRPKGIVFQRSTSATPQVATMCHWCHRVRGNGGVKLLTVRSDERHTIGQYLCSDLSCLSTADAADVDGLRETLHRDAQRARTRERIRSFAARRLF